MTTLSLSPDDIMLLSALAQAEAGGMVDSGVADPREAYGSVADVVLNRMASPVYPDTVSEIISQKAQFEPVSKYGGADKLPKPSSDTVAALKAYLEDRAKGIEGVVGKATNFLNPFYSGSKARQTWAKDYMKWPSIGKGKNVHFFGSLTDVPDYSVAIGEGDSPLAGLFTGADGMASTLANAGELAPLAEGGASMMADLGAAPVTDMASGVGAMGGTGIPWADIALIAANAFSNMGQPDPQAQAMAERNSQQAADEATQRRMAWAMQNGFGRGLG